MKEATTTEEGISRRSCNNCSATESRSISKLSEDGHTHTFGEWKTVNAATCTKPGKAERICSICSIKETQELTAVGHSYSNWSIKQYPTEKAEGILERVCSNCTANETQSIPKLVPSPTVEQPASTPESTENVALESTPIATFEATETITDVNGPDGVNDFIVYVIVICLFAVGIGTFTALLILRKGKA